jgi:hypothetical protein
LRKSVPGLDRGVELSADVLDRLLHMREQSFELWKHRHSGFGRHLANLRELAILQVAKIVALLDVLALLAPGDEPEEPTVE